MDAENSNYKNGKDRLVEAVKRIHEAEQEWGPTPLKKDIERISTKLEEAARLLENVGCAQFDIEILHNERGIPERVIGTDGWPVEQIPIIDWPSYKAVIWHIRGLAESAQLAAKQLPNPRAKRALRYAARGLLHLRCNYGFARPSLYDNSEDVQELKQVCEQAGIFLTVERYRGALAESFKTFDPHYMEQHYHELFQ